VVEYWLLLSLASTRVTDDDLGWQQRQRFGRLTPDQVNDAQAAELSEQIARKIENELQYPGQIRVVVIRETRAVDFAR
jgi:HD superfamily phosphodiesterase